MNIDIRLSLGFLDHPKTKKLQKRLGDAAVICLLRLWMWAAENRPTGKLTGMDSEDVELAAGWTGDDGVFFRSLTDCRWVDVTDDGLSLHGWEENQQYAAKSEERHERAKKAAQARWETKQAEQEHSLFDANGMLKHATSINEHVTSNAPRHQDTKIPSINLTPPSPSQGALCAPEDASQEKYPADFEEFWKLYPKKADKLNAAKAWKKQKAKIPKLDVLKAAIESQQTSDQWQRGIIPHAATWLNGHRWQDELEQQTNFIDRDLLHKWNTEYAQ